MAIESVSVVVKFDLQDFCEAVALDYALRAIRPKTPHGMSLAHNGFRRDGVKVTHRAMRNGRTTITVARVNP